MGCESINSSCSLVAVIVLVLAAEAVDKDANGNAADDSNQDADDQAKAARGMFIAFSLATAVDCKDVQAFR